MSWQDKAKTNPGQRSLAKSDWPLFECLINQDWQDPTSLCQILVARKSVQGEIAFSFFLVDLACLGVKNAGYGRGAWQYEQIKEAMGSTQDMVPCSLDLAAKVLSEAILYAKRWGFEPHKDYAKAKALLKGANPIDTPIPTGGPTGKPFYVAGPYDNIKLIIATLNRTAGEGNYDFLLPL